MSKAAVRGAKSTAKCMVPPTSCFHLEILFFFFFSFPHVFHKLGRFDMITAASVSRAVLLSNSARSETKERIVRADSEGKCVAAGGLESVAAFPSIATHEQGDCRNAW